MNDDITSLIASPGISVRLCAENGGWGDCQDYGGEVSYVGSLLNQRASNVEVRPGVTVYRGQNFAGIAQAFPAGDHPVTSLTIVGNDQISSLVVAPGMMATLCAENGGWGDCETFTGWVSWVGETLDNRTSNIEVAPIP